MGTELYDVIDANDRRGASWEVGATHDQGLVLSLGPATVVLYGELRDRYAEAVARAVTAGQAGPGSLAPPPPGDPAESAYLARRASCRRCGEPGLVPCPAVLGLWLSDRQGTGRGLCPDGEMHQAENITEGIAPEAAQAAGTEEP